MSRGPNPIRLIFVIVITCVLTFKGIAWINAADAPPIAPTGTGAVSGVVVDAYDRPVAEAVLVARLDADRRIRWFASSDADGRYAFESLPAAALSISASKDGHLDLGGPRGAGAMQVTLDDGDRRSDVTVVLPREASIAGEVRGIDGTPAAGTFVRAFRVTRTPHGDELSEPAAIAGVDAQGRYRVTALPAGEYFVMAALDRNEHARVYHPAADSLRGATSVRVESGEVRTGVDLRAPSLARAAVHGRVVDAAGRSTPATVTLSWTGLERDRRITVATDDDGRFRFDDVAAGPYWLTARTGADENDREAAWAVTRVNAPGQHPLEIELSTRVGYVIDGRVTVDPGDAALTAEGHGAARGIEVVLYALDEPALAALDTGTRRTSVSDAGTFELAGLPAGTYRVEVTTDDGFGLRDVREDGSGWPGDAPLTVGTDAPRRSLDVTLTTQPGRLAGVDEDRGHRVGPTASVAR